MKLCIVAITLLLAGCGSVVTVGQRFVGEYDHVYETTYLEGLMLVESVTGNGEMFAPSAWAAPAIAVDIPLTATTETVLLPVDAVVFATGGY